MNNEENFSPVYAEVPLQVKVLKSLKGTKIARERKDIFFNTGKEGDIPNLLKNSVKMIDGTIQYIGNYGVIKIPTGEFVGYNTDSNRIGYRCLA